VFVRFIETEVDTKIKPINTEADYEAALVEIERLRSAEPGGPDSDKLDVLATLVEKYEDEHWLIDPPDHARLEF
jgi:HTH-type transcriptional regulator/antitoxin HigA